MIFLNNKNNNKQRNKTKNNTETKGSIFDPNGSWTGVPLDKFEKPIQDADDL